MADNKNQNTISQQQLEEISIIASVAQLSLVILTVVYSPENPDLWDLAIAGFVIFVGLRFREVLWHSQIAITLAIAGLAISWMIIIQFILFYTNVWGTLLNATINGIRAVVENDSLILGLVDSAAELLVVAISYLIIFLLIKKMRRQKD